MKQGQARRKTTHEQAAVGRVLRRDLSTITDALSRSSFTWALHDVGDHWSVVIIRAAFLGAKTFDEFRARLCIPRQTLSDRLQHLTEVGVLAPQRYHTQPQRFHYHLAAKGRALYPAVLSTWAWRTKWAPGSDGLPRRLIHKTCGAHFTPQCVCASCRSPVELRALMPRFGASDRDVVPPLRSRRLAGATDHRLPGDAALQMSLAVDRWAQLILVTIMLGCRHFDELQAVLGIGSNILTGRLEMLCSCAMLRRDVDRRDHRRRLYSLTPMSEDLISRMMTLANWHRELEPKAGEPIEAVHKVCGRPFKPVVVCDHCRNPLRVNDVSFEF